MGLNPGLCDCCVYYIRMVSELDHLQLRYVDNNRDQDGVNWQMQQG